MELFNFEQQSNMFNGVLVLAAAAVIGWAGSRLEHFANAIARKTGKGDVIIGMVLLAIATSLPEIATSTTAVSIGNIDLAVHNLLGSVIVLTGILAVTDLTHPGALTFFAPQIALVMQAVGLIALLSVVLMGFIIGGAAVTLPFGAGVRFDFWCLGILAIYGICILWTQAAEKEPKWRPSQEPQIDYSQRKEIQYSLKKLGGMFFFFALVVATAGWTVTQAVNAVAQKTGWASSFLGITIMALITSLPELAATTAAVRRNSQKMAVANVFGSNLFVVALLGFNGLLPREKSIFAEIDDSGMFAASLGIFITGVYMWGLIERRNRTIGRMGWDSLIVLSSVIFGLWMIYRLK